MSTYKSNQLPDLILNIEIVIGVEQLGFNLKIFYPQAKWH
jgi:hypothetical protein